MASAVSRSTSRCAGLLVHQVAGFTENGMAVSLSYHPTRDTPLGLTARVSPAWGGDTTDGTETLWARRR